MKPDDLQFIAAPMVKQSDLPFRLLVSKYGATCTYTQMLFPDKLVNDREYLEYHLRDLTSTTIGGMERSPVVVQLCGNDPQMVVDAGRKVQAYCDGIDLNLGCPQTAAQDGHYGAYLLDQGDWPLVENIVSAMARTFTVPVSAKMRLCQPSSKTVELAGRLEASGASWIALHARTVSSRRRRHGPADLNIVKELKEGLKVPVISNGNVREWADLQANLSLTNADGVMVGEPLLANPCLFAKVIPDPIDISLEYLDLCRQYPETVPISSAATHIRHFLEFRCERRSWFPKFRTALNSVKTLDDLDSLLRQRVKRWRGRPKEESRHVDDDSTDHHEKEVGGELDLSLIY